MPKTTTTYTILISCPSDIKEEIKIIEEVLKGFNDNLGKNIGIYLECSYWEKDVIPQHGNRPQEIINEQIVEKSDAIIAVFGERFGSDTGKYPSGTIEEIEEMIKAKKQVFLYFSEKPIERKNINSKLEELEKFKKEYSKKGIYSVYKNNDEFKEKITNHIYKYFLKIENSGSINEYGKLIIKSYNNKNSLETYLQYHEIIEDYNIIIEDKKDKIINLINEIKKINIEHMATIINGLVSSTMYFKDYEKIIYFSGEFKLGIDINNFFNLGNYSPENPYATIEKVNYMFGNTYNFDDKLENLFKKEIDKYDKICLLIELIKQYYEFKEYFEYLSNIKCLSFAVINESNIYNENIEVRIKVSKDCFIKVDKIESPKENISNIINKSMRKYIFHDIKTIQSITINGYNREVNNIGNYVLILQFYFNKYSFSYDENEDIYITFKIEKLNSGSGIWFPTILFFKEKMQEIEYSITSKNTNKINGIIKIK